MKHQLKFDITNLQGKSIIEAYPALAAYKEFEGKDDKVIAYVIYAYDKGSDFMKIKDPLERKSRALLEAGYSKAKNGEWSDMVCDYILKNLNQDVAAMATRYIRIQNDRKFAFYIHGQEMVWQNIEKVSKPIEQEEMKSFSLEIDHEKGAVSLEEAKKASKGQDEKEKDIQAAYKLRNDIYNILPEQIEKLDKVEKEIFPENDPDSIQMVNDYVQQQKPGRVESRLMRG